MPSLLFYRVVFYWLASEYTDWHFVCGFDGISLTKSWTARYTSRRASRLLGRYVPYFETTQAFRVLGLILITVWTKLIRGRELQVAEIRKWFCEPWRVQGLRGHLWSSGEWRLCFQMFVVLRYKQLRFASLAQSIGNFEILVRCSGLQWPLPTCR